MWWRFRKHRVAMISVAVIVLFYLVALFADFLSGGNPEITNEHFNYVPPQTIHWFDDGWVRPYVHDITSDLDLSTFKKTYDVDTEVKYPVRFFGHGYEYTFLGLITTTRHLMVVETPERPRAPFIIGGDAFGRDLFSRILHGTRISLSIGLAGVSVSIILGVALGGLSGYYGGVIDTVVQRMIEILRSIPTIPLWLALAASLPKEWSITRVYFAVTIILSLYAWTELARVVRGRFLAMREDDFIMAAKLADASDSRIIFRHMVPNFASHLIAAATLFGAVHDNQRDGPELPRAGPAASSDQLGRASQGRTERTDGSAVSLGDARRRAHDSRRAGIQLRGGRASRCRRPVRIGGSL